MLILRLSLVFLQMADVVENEAKMAYMRPPGGSAAAVDEQRGPSKGFVVREAPWTTSSEKVSTFSNVSLFITKIVWATVAQ